MELIICNIDSMQNYIFIFCRALYACVGTSDVHQSIIATTASKSVDAVTIAKHAYTTRPQATHHFALFTLTFNSKNPIDRLHIGTIKNKVKDFFGGNKRAQLSCSNSRSKDYKVTLTETPSTRP